MADMAAVMNRLRAERPSRQAGPDHDVLIECSSARPAFTSGLRRLRSGGRAALVGAPKTETGGAALAGRSQDSLKIVIEPQRLAG